eukprot:6186477-Pleurochrysis_carterae.AAC.2
MRGAYNTTAPAAKHPSAKHSSALSLPPQTKLAQGMAPAPLACARSSSAFVADASSSAALASGVRQLLVAS